MPDNTKNRTYKNLIEAHSWLGLSISAVLFLIFWAGSISLFRSEINDWASLPHAPIDKQAADIPINDIINTALTRYHVDYTKPLSVFLPNSERPYYWVIFDTVKTADDKKTRKRLKINAKTGEVSPGDKRFVFADFMYRLHYELNLGEVGEYFIGAVTLIFLFGLFSGVFIHAKRLIPSFFNYRIRQKRSQLFDLHTVIGTISLPFTLMYAITGLMFNLAVVYQFMFVGFFYQGDEAAYKDDARPVIYKPSKPIGTPHDMTKISAVVDDTENALGKARMVKIYNYGDAAATLEIRGKQDNHFAQRYTRYVGLNDGSTLAQSDYSNFNSLQKGRAVMSALHFGDFASFSLRLIYFVLAVLCAMMIVGGCFLWEEKRRAAKEVSPKVTAFFSKLTFGVCGGLVVATSLGFLLERTLPLNLADRGDTLVIALLAAFIIGLFSAYVITSSRQFISATLYCTALLLAVTFVCDWLFFSDALMLLTQSGSPAVIAVNIALVISGMVCFFTARRLCR